MIAEKPRGVLDCMIYLQAVARETSPAAACLRLSESRRIELFISRQIIAEVRDVLSRDDIRRRFKTVTDESVANFIERVRKTSKLIKTIPKRFDYRERDVKDEPYINLAIRVRADYLVSRDKDLLDLMSWNREAGRDFQKRFPFLKIVTPEDFLDEIEQSGAAQ